MTENFLNAKCFSAWSHSRLKLPVLSFADIFGNLCGTQCANCLQLLPSDKQKWSLLGNLRVTVIKKGSKIVVILTKWKALHILQGGKSEIKT